MQVLKMYQKLSKYPAGKYIFSKLFCLKAPYFGTVKPRFSELAPGRCVVSMKKRRAVHNHIASVHATAMCTLAEAAGGLCTEVSIPKDMRWIPKGMEVKYLKKAMSHLTATCNIDVANLKLGDNPVEVEVRDAKGDEVFHASITMYLSSKEKN